MIVQTGLLALVRNLSADVAERRRLACAVVGLVRQRRRLLGVLGLGMARVPAGGNPKLHLWARLAHGLTARGVRTPDHQASAALCDAIQATQAYQHGVERLRLDRNGFVQRGRNYQALRNRWRETPPTRLIVFHHFDRRGRLPRSWLQTLALFQAKGWTVLVSSSWLDAATTHQLQRAGVDVALRSNCGLCLGAYRDLILLFLFLPCCGDRLRSLILLNDSTVPVEAPEVLVEQCEHWLALETGEDQPVLAGLTDSVERGRYHLQSYLLYANQALLQHPAWLRFWLRLSVDGSKDDLIDQGEIGLSQTLLAAGVTLKPEFSLVEGLMRDPGMAEELQRYGISQPDQANQSLFAWSSLIKRGFPLVKKHVLFHLIQQHGHQPAMAELARLVAPDQVDRLAADLRDLLISRYSDASTRMD